MIIGMALEPVVKKVGANKPSTTSYEYFHGYYCNKRKGLVGDEVAQGYANRDEKRKQKAVSPDEFGLV